jgi:hypothetical protein
MMVVRFVQNSSMNNLGHDHCCDEYLDEAAGAVTGNKVKARLGVVEMGRGSVTWVQQRPERDDHHG